LQHGSADHSKAQWENSRRLRTTTRLLSSEMGP
jgi:hypothetical protein